MTVSGGPLGRDKGTDASGSAGAITGSGGRAVVETCGADDWREVGGTRGSLGGGGTTDELDELTTDSPEEGAGGVEGAGLGERATFP